MPNNKRLIEQLAHEFYCANWQGIANLVSPTFIFKSPAMPSLNFEQYSEHMNNIFAHIQISNPEIIERGNRRFDIEFMLGLINTKLGMRQELACKVEITLVEEKIDCLEIFYDQHLLNNEQLSKYTS